MITYKGFTKDLTARMGDGIFQYKFGQTFKNDAAQCAKTGFHSVEEPIRVLNWYGAASDRYCVVKIGGDIHEDGQDRISSTEITLIRELDIFELAMEECRWIYQHPNRTASTRVERDKAYGIDSIVIVRGKNPVAAGKKGAVLYLLKEKKRSRQIDEMAVYEVDGKTFKPGKYYDVDGKEVC